jgi:hypothetical protein
MSAAYRRKYSEAAISRKVMTKPYAEFGFHSLIVQMLYPQVQVEFNSLKPM